MTNTLHMIQIKQLSKRYANGLLALDKVNISIKKGQFFGLLGLNGAGKSTFINILCHILNKTSGSIVIDGLDFETHTIEVKKKMGFMAQELNFNPFSTVSESLLYQAGYYGMTGPSVKEHITQLLQQLRLSDKRDTAIRMLSGGMKRRVLLARALITKPDYLFLDEPTAGVDVDLRQDIYRLLKDVHAQGTTIILTSHYMEDIENLCTFVAVIHKGNLVNQGPIDSIDLGDSSQPTYTIHTIADVPTTMRIAGLDIRQMSPRCIEVTVTNNRNTHEWLNQLAQEGVEVKHINSSKNRLESYMSQYTTEEP